MLANNTIVSALSAYVPAMPFAPQWAAANYDWIQEAPGWTRPVYNLKKALVAMGHTYCTSASVGIHGSEAALTFLRSYINVDGVNRADTLLALAGALHAIAGFDRLAEAALDVSIGLGRYGVVTDGLVACAMLAAYAQKGDMQGVAISAVKLSSVAVFGNNALVDAAVDIVYWKYADSQREHQTGPDQPPPQPHHPNFYPPAGHLNARAARAQRQANPLAVISDAPRPVKSR